MWTISHPLEAIRPDRRGRIFAILACATGALIAAIWFGKDIDTWAAPYGLFSFELAGDPFVARTIFNTWLPDDQLYAAYLVGLRYLLALAYSATMAIGCLWAAGELRWLGRTFAWAGIILAWLQIVAGVLDSLASLALITALVDQEFERWSGLILMCATAKYAILGAGLLYIALVPGARVLRVAAPKSTGRSVPARQE